MNILKRLQDVIKGFNRSNSDLEQKKNQVKGIKIESIDANEISKYEQLTDGDKKRVDRYIKELNDEWTSNLKENPLRKLIVFENENAEKSQELFDLILLIIQRIDTSSRDMKFTDVNGITKDSVELKILMEVLRTYDKLLHEIEQEIELKLIVLDELKKKLDTSHISSSGEKQERVNQFKTIINNAIERMLICRQIESYLRHAADREIENCNTNAIFRELFTYSIWGLDFQTELESSVVNQLFEEMQQKIKILPGFNMETLASEITPEYLANCYAKLGINRKLIISKLEPEIQELKKSAENIWATRMKLIRPEESAQLPFGIMGSNENKLRDNLANRLKKLEDKYNALGIFANQKLTKSFYDTKLKTEALLSKNWIKQYAVDYYGRDTKEFEIYRQIMVEKIQRICSTDPVDDNIIHFGKENFNTLISFIREHFGDEKDIDIKHVLEDTYMFEMILAVESEYSIKKRRERGVAVIQSGVEATKVNTRMQVIDDSTVTIRLPKHEDYKTTENIQEL